MCAMHEMIRDKRVNTIDIRDCDPHSNQRHHCWTLLLQFHLRSAQERLTAIEEQNRG